MLTLYSQLGGVGKWDTDHGEELSQCTGMAELTQWCDVLLELLLLTNDRLNVHYPARRAILPVTRDALALAQQMLRTDYSQRPTAQECLTSAYFIDSSTTIARKDALRSKTRRISSVNESWPGQHLGFVPPLRTIVK
jgi:hypothetical protein